MKTISRIALFTALLITTGLLASCSGSSDLASSLSVFGIPKAEMKCNGQSCIE